jgi:hypothetical protein
MSAMRSDPPPLVTGSDVVREAATASSATRWLAESIVRHDVES